MGLPKFVTRLMPTEKKKGGRVSNKIEEAIIQQYTDALKEFMNARRIDYTYGGDVMHETMMSEHTRHRLAIELRSCREAVRTYQNRVALARKKRKADNVVKPVDDRYFDMEEFKRAMRP